MKIYLNLSLFFILLMVSKMPAKLSHFSHRSEAQWKEYSTADEPISRHKPPTGDNSFLLKTPTAVVPSLKVSTISATWC